MLLLALVVTANSQTLDLPVEVKESEELNFRWSEDSWTGEDKRDHFIGGFGLMGISSLVWLPESNGDVWRNAGYSTLFWTLWEVKDAIMPWEMYGYWGGDGFSYKDATVSALGVGAATVLVFLIK